MATTPTAISSTTISSFSTHRLRPLPSHTFHKFPSPNLTLRVNFFPIRASKTDTEEPNPTPTTIISSFQEDASYLLKLALGSVIGAAIIKYGCVVFPDITRPDIVQALLMISAPAVASVILLSFGSRPE